MSRLIGLDIGTSSVKAMLMEEDGKCLGITNAAYDVDIPRVGWAEQNPDMWYEKTTDILKELLSKEGLNSEEIRALSFSGQMHGLVCVDREGRPVRPAIIWPDQRTLHTIEQIYEKLGSDFVAKQTQNKIATGFLLGSLCWVKDNEPEVYEKTFKVMLPKDYVKFRLTGRIATDYSDAAGSLAFDNVNLCWAKELIEGLGLDFSLFPELLTSHDVMGEISGKEAEKIGFKAPVKVSSGGSDQCMQAVGNGITADGIFASNIGTGGQISTTASSPFYDEKLRTNTFAHVIPGRWNIMGACLSSGASLKWLTKEIIGVSDYNLINQEAAKLPPGSEGLVFLPYLTGERTPHHDPMAKGMFGGLTSKHGRFHMARAVMEGVTYSLKDCMNVIMEMGISCTKVIAAGGGANSPLWLQIQADILERDIYKSMNSEQACYGAAITAGMGIGIYSSFEEASGKMIKLDDKVYTPIAENVKIYREYYEIFREFYRNNKELFARLHVLSSGEEEKV